MKKSSSRHKGVQDPGQLAVQQPDKAGWIRKFCGRGIFRELWRNRFVVLRGDHLYICDKEVKDERKAQEVFHLADYERSEELRKAKSRSKKNHSRFTLLRCNTPGTTAPPLVFLAVSPEDKESWVNALNVAIIKAKSNRLLDEVRGHRILSLLHVMMSLFWYRYIYCIYVCDQVTIDDDDVLTHPTRERAKIHHVRRLPTRGHLLSVASSSSHGMLTLDLVTEEDALGDSSLSWENSFRVDLQRGGSCGQVAVVGSCGVRGRQRAGTDVSKLRVTTKEPKVKTGSLPRGSESSWTRGTQLDILKTRETQLDVLKTREVQVLQSQSKTPQLEKKVKGQGRSRCSSLDQVLARPAVIRRCPTEDEAVGGACVQPVGGACVQPVGQLQSLIAQKMQRAQELLEEMRLQELQKSRTERGGRSTLTKNIDSPLLHHLRGSDSPHCRSSPRSRSSDCPRLRGKESPRLRGRDSPRSKAKRNRCRGTESPRSRRCNSPAAPAHDSPKSLSNYVSNASDASNAESNAESNANDDSSMQKSCKSPLSVGDSASSQVKVSRPESSRSNSQTESPQALLTTPPSLLPEDEAEMRRAEAERLLQEAVSSWKEAQEVLQEVKELQSRTLQRRQKKTHNNMTSAAEEDTPTSPTSAEEDDGSEMP
ncbi:pleckstrin homology domain-containing family O member 1-A isoform X2 [Solea solea]|uniref:pleckstrin homology domain-containing family O member 1-A isoform X2 n=1 Tax=Solea solea TaxID=90069 RepID=UPI00272BBC61|nr:pleckstrin homology domain-containing family O member 1-A isoform X2 [Solea solea]